MRKIFRILVIAIGTVIGGHSYGASVVIDDFESGGISGWYSQSYLGYSTATSTRLGTFFNTIEGNASGVVVALSTTSYPEQCEREAWNNACARPMPLLPSGASAPTFMGDRLPGHGTVESMYWYGAYLGRDISVSTGDVLTWSWNAYGEASPLSPYSDHVRFMAINANDQFWFDAHGSNEQFVFPEAGTWSIFFGIAQREDPQVYSAVVLDSIILNTIPEPSGVVLVVLAGVILWHARRYPKSAVRQGHQESS